MSKSQLEDEFETRWMQLAPDAPAPIRDGFKPIPGRRFRFDFCWPDKLTALEVMGGSRGYGRHNRPEGQQQDYTKHNLAVLLGWRILYVTGEMLHEDPAGLVEMILVLLK